MVLGVVSVAVLVKAAVRVAKAASVASLRAASAANAVRVAQAVVARVRAVRPSLTAIPAMPRTSRPITPGPAAHPRSALGNAIASSRPTRGCAGCGAETGVVCPLTSLEMALRVRGHGATYDEGFIEHWLQSILYHDAPPWVFTLGYTLFGLAVVASWWYFPPEPFRSRRKAKA